MQVLVWSEAEWHVFRPLYEQLLAKSSADRLFLSWDWLDLWWKHLARQPGDAFRTYVMVERGQLIGAMPVLVGQRKRRGMYIRAVTLLGASGGATCSTTCRWRSMRRSTRRCRWA